MPVAGPAVGEAVGQILADRGISYRPGSQITAAEPGRLHFGDQAEDTNLLVYMPPITAPPVIGDSALAADDGWIHADPHHLGTGFDGVWAIGDNVQILLPMGKPLPCRPAQTAARTPKIALRGQGVAGSNPVSPTV
jgi:NADH dehydrogenase FAD-containing subunit